jgi:hypothetical protein
MKNKIHRGLTTLLRTTETFVDTKNKVNTGLESLCIFNNLNYI